jgi:hypothetical protein
MGKFAVLGAHFLVAPHDAEWPFPLAPTYVVGCQFVELHSAYLVQFYYLMSLSHLSL